METAELKGRCNMSMNFEPEWDGFEPGRWSTTSVNVRDFIQKNYTPYDGDESFLEAPTQATLDLWEQVCQLTKEPQKPLKEWLPLARWAAR